MGFDNNIPQFDLSYANNMLDSIQRDQEELLRAIERRW